MSDKLEKVFELQTGFMQLLKDHDKMPEWPFDLKTKMGQRAVKEMVWNLVEELAEASFTLKNRMHKMTDDQAVDFEHYKEELGDAFAFFLEICIVSGISANDLFQEYSRKNSIVKERLLNGY